jgi:hypothetical protein
VGSYNALREPGQAEALTRAFGKPAGVLDTLEVGQQEWAVRNFVGQEGTYWLLEVWGWGIGAKQGNSVVKDITHKC